jgi:hypothetical protein
MPIPIEEQLEMLSLEVLVTESPPPLRRRHDPESGAALIDLS